MLGRIREYFLGEQTDLVVDRAGYPSDEELHTATAVLLLEGARADSNISHGEAQTICDLMKEAFGLPAEKLPDLIRVATAARQNAGKTDHFFAVLNENFNKTQRKQIFAMVWKVMQADGCFDRFERSYASQVRTRLLLTEEDKEEALDEFEAR
jgi:uncharacterized tellurite resistance protein B-like protein